MTAVTAGLIGLAFGLIGTWLARALALQLSIVSYPNPLVAQHTRPVAYLGGVGICIGVLTGIYVTTKTFGSAQAHIPNIFLGALMFLTLGLLDDLYAFPPSLKFLLQLTVLAAVLALGVGASLTQNITADLLISGFWILALVNAVNFTDVCDGLVGGLVIVAFLVLSVLLPEFQVPCLVIAGATTGFLVFNLPPASIFLGEAGTSFLGFLLAALTLHGATTTTQPRLSMLAALVMVAGVPLFEVSFITAMRIRKGLPWWKGSPDHFALRLQARGLSRWQVDVLAWTIGGVLGIVAMLLTHVGPVAMTALILSVGAVLLVAGLFLGHSEVTPPL